MMEMAQKIFVDTVNDARCKSFILVVTRTSVAHNEQCILALLADEYLLSCSGRSETSRSRPKLATRDLRRGGVAFIPFRWLNWGNAGRQSFSSFFFLWATAYPINIFIKERRDAVSVLMFRLCSNSDSDERSEECIGFTIM